MARELPAPFGEYVLLARLGAGAAAEAFLARPLDPRLPQLLVIKRLHGFSEDSEREARFRHEAELATRIDSPFLPRVHDVGAVDGIPYFALDYFEGWTLHRIMTELEATKRNAAVASSVRVAIDILSGLEALHDSGLGVVHRDISPKNVILGTDGRARLIDLGIGWSKLKDFETATGAVLGSPGYMAPEQVRAEPVDGRTDLYAVGILLWEMLTLEDYITRGPLHSMLLASSSPSYRAARSIRGEVPDAIDRVLSRALQPDPARRYPSAVAMRRALEGALEARESTTVGALVDEALLGESATGRQEIDRLVEEATQVARSPARTEVYARRELADEPRLEPTVGARPSRRASQEPHHRTESEGSPRPSRLARQGPAPELEVEAFSEGPTETFSASSIDSEPGSMKPEDTAGAFDPRVIETDPGTARRSGPPSVPTPAPSPAPRKGADRFGLSVGIGASAALVLGLWFGRTPAPVEAPSVTLPAEPVAAPDPPPDFPGPRLRPPLPVRLDAATVLDASLPDPRNRGTDRPDKAARRVTRKQPAEEVRAPPKPPRRVTSKELLERARGERQRHTEGSAERVEADRILGELLRWSEKQEDADERLVRLDASLRRLEDLQ
ncbi:MAG: protein kinase [Deltaproteobacteria bacterium]|nr:protein kinase [Deltaproteobacteria bacterium]